MAGFQGRLRDALAAGDVRSLIPRVTLFAESGKKGHWSAVVRI